MIQLASLVASLAAWTSVNILPASSAMATHVGGAKTIRFLRHGQAAHNINAERMREAGCSYDAFIQAMKDDDEFDAQLTALGRKQAADTAALPACQAARLSVELVVASSLSRAIDTADLAFPPGTTPRAGDGSRVCSEDLREVVGLLVNGKRRTKTDLIARNPHWNFDNIKTEEDVLWDAWGAAQLEEQASTQRRAHALLVWLWHRAERDIAVVGHGGIFALLTNGHEFVECGPEVAARFKNCELRSCRLEMIGGGLLHWATWRQALSLMEPAASEGAAEGVRGGKGWG